MSQSPPWDQGQSSSQGQPPSWPAGGRPPSWRSAGPDQGQPPPWPPEGQQPYPGPGSTYGHGPRPPRFRRRNRFRRVPLIMLGFLIVFGIMARSITTSHNNAVSTTPLPFPSVSAMAAGTQGPPGKIGSAFDLKDDRGDVYRVTLIKVIDPARPTNQFNSADIGKRLVGAVFRIKALTGGPKDEDANDDAVLVGGNGQNYEAKFDIIAGHTNFDSGAIHVTQGDTVTGSVTFQIPDGVAVSKVQWNTLSGFGSTVAWLVPD